MTRSNYDETSLLGLIKNDYGEFFTALLVFVIIVGCYDSIHFSYSGFVGSNTYTQFIKRFFCIIFIIIRFNISSPIVCVCYFQSKVAS